MTTFKTYRPATLPALKRQLRASVIGGFFRKLAEFGDLFHLYRRAGHRLTYCAWIAWQITVKRCSF